MRGSGLVRIVFLSFAIAQFISLLGDRLHQLSVVGMIGRVTGGSSVDLFQLGVFTHLPALLFAPFFGSLVDRWSRAGVLLVSDALRGLVVLTIPAIYLRTDSLYAFYVPVLILSMLNLLFSPAKSAAIPEFFGTLRLVHLNAVLWGLGVVATLAGFLLAGWFFDYRSWELSFYYDGASYLVSALLLLPLLLVRNKRPRAGPRRNDGPWQGLQVIRSDPRVRSLLVVQSLFFAALGVLYVVGISRIQMVLPPQKTMPLAAVASSGTIGLLLGSALAVVARERVPAGRLVAGSTILFGITWIGLGTSVSTVAIASWALVMGFSASPTFVLSEALLQTHVPGAVRGRVFAAREIATRSLFLLASLVATIATIALSKAMILVCTGVLLALIGALFLARLNFLRA